MQKFVYQELGSCSRGGGGRVLPYISHLVRYVPQGMHFAHFGIAWNRVWFSRELQECMSVFIVLIPNK